MNTTNLHFETEQEREQYHLRLERLKYIAKSKFDAFFQRSILSQLPKQIVMFADGHTYVFLGIDHFESWLLDQNYFENVEQK